MRVPKTVAFAGGGSGGHLYPQIAVARALQAIDPAVRMYFVSARGSVEERLVSKEGFEIFLIPSGKLKGQSIFSVLKTLFALFLSAFVCVRILRRRRPDMIFSAGGYAGAPFLVAGALLGIRCEILEQNRIPGLANRWMARFCRRIYVNFGASAAAFGGKETVAVGHPCRPEFEKARWGSEFSSRLTATPFRLFVFGGSQGAMGINRLVTAASAHFDGLDIEILHQTGEADFERVRREYAEAGFSAVQMEKFIFEMADALKAAHLVVCRAGASSLAELAAAEKATILIPLVSKDRHQEHNAREMARLGAALAFPQQELTGEALAAKVKELYYRREEIASLARKMGTLHKADAASRIAKNILER